METDELGVALRTTRRRAQADEWALVLAAEGLHPLVRGDRDGFAVTLPAHELERAEHALEAWQRENQRAPRPPERPPLDRHPVGHALVAALALLVAFAVMGPARDADAPWAVRGGADAALVRGGEPWRAVTALTLHADLAHVLGNAVTGALFLAAVFPAFGVGVGVALVLAAGAAGNLANAFLRPGDHASIGASTAVFGAVGILAGFGMSAGRMQRRGRAAWLPLGAALALLAMIGTEGERVDLWAHAFGLAAGLPLGALASAIPVAWLARPAVQAAAGLFAATLLAGAWALAL